MGRCEQARFLAFCVAALWLPASVQAATTATCSAGGNFSGGAWYFVNSVAGWAPAEGPWNSRDPASFQTLRYSHAEARKSATNCIRFEDIRAGGGVGLMDSASANANHSGVDTIVAYAWSNIGSVRASAQVRQNEPVSYASLDAVAHSMSRSAFIDLLQISSVEEFGFLRGKVRISGSIQINPQVQNIFTEPGIEIFNVFSRDVVSEFNLIAESAEGATYVTQSNYIGRAGYGAYTEESRVEGSWKWETLEEGERSSFENIGVYIRSDVYSEVLNYTVREQGVFDSLNVDRTLEFLIPYSIHEPVWLFQHLTCGIGGGRFYQAAPSPYGNARCSFSESAHWLGAVLTDRQGKVVDGSVWSASGFDYLKPSPFLSSPSTGVIPEPGTWALLIAGFGVVGASLRRRREVAA